MKIVFIQLFFIFKFYHILFVYEVLKPINLAKSIKLFF